MVVVDNTFLTLMLHPEARPPLDPATGTPVSRLRERIDLLIETLVNEGEMIIIPSPVLSEFLILADKDGPKYLSDINSDKNLLIEPFDQKAAIELAAIHIEARSSRSKNANKRGDAQGTWAKIKFDRQIVAIAKVNNAHTIYTDDENVVRFAEDCGITAVRTWELSLPAEKHPLFPELTEESAPRLLTAGSDEDAGVSE